MEEKRTYQSRLAAAALAAEWVEWIRVAEHATRAGRINIVLGLGHVANVFAPEFAVAGQGRYLFANYIRAQVANGHTAGYDPAAVAPFIRWVGAQILQRYAGTAVLEITQRQLTAWLTGSQRYLKPAANNPFTPYKPA